MKILIVASYNKGRFSPFIVEQVEALKKRCGSEPESKVEIDWFGVQAHGIRGYLRNLPALREKILQFKPDIIHAHYGLSGLLATIQRLVPVVITYHGSDINIPKIRLFSQLAVWRADWNIFVSQHLKDLVWHRKNYSILPCGINLDELPIITHTKARKLLGWTANKSYIVFAGALDNAVKNSPLAKKAVVILNERLQKQSDINNYDAGESYSKQRCVELIELKGYTREQVNLLFSAADCMLLTSHSEGSPQVVKEAMAAGCPIVSVDVGDVRERIGKLDGCFVADSREPQHIADLLHMALTLNIRTTGRETIIKQNLDNCQIANLLLNRIYPQII